MSRRCVELAKSGRSACKKCKVKIDKDELRVGVISMKDDHEMTSWYHPTCCPKKKGGDLEPDDFEGFDSLTPAHKSVIEDLCAGELPSAKKQKVSAGPSPRLDDPNATEPGFKALYDKYTAVTLPILKDWLEVNEQPKTGTKPELVSACVDGELHGALPRCPMCEYGRLKRQGTGFVCKGYFSDEVKTWRTCPFTSPADMIERLEWRSPDQGPREKPGVEKAGGKAALVDSLDTTPLEGLGLREQAEKLVEWARKVNLSLAEDGATATIAAGTALNGTRTEESQVDLKAAAAELVRKFPPRTENKVLKAVHEGNGKICALLKEYGDLMEKHGENVHGVRGTRKALSAIMGLTYEITDPKVLLAKGTKVDGVGKGTADKIAEILEKGTFDKLEEFRAKDAAL